MKCDKCGYDRAKDRSNIVDDLRVIRTIGVKWVEADMRLGHVVYAGHTILLRIVDKLISKLSGRDQVG